MNKVRRLIFVLAAVVVTDGHRHRAGGFAQIQDQVSGG